MNFDPQALATWVSVVVFVSLVFLVIILLIGWLQKRRDRDRE
ncbi:hypothetical protein [Deinococcus cellulosilyticus]|uniref:Uncharacterized protein n=1 Tax=Deinococcus cellulosilyticus (strain DSM 18568 / NBRC 106333 / KACC 11606 / 5516J-15) TaxID=1223518 RepID=A0A511NAX2_DEIC1|nr:hypothetical protein [Deinococcus cellulosilyticus]GEM49932.1 hypothetical protein DC3_55670 [Deinococcus cellulosilyticus NBRC 106333 = KACC 11606]